MMIQRFLMTSVFVVGVLLLVGSCKDMGNEVPAPPMSVGRSSFTLVPGGISGTRISGGKLPYSLVSRGNTNVVDASITGDSLSVRGVGIGNTTIVVGDNSSPRLSITLNITVAALAVGQSSFNLVAGDTSSTTISGGAAPYSFISRGDTTIVLPSIIGSSLSIRAISAGSSTIVVGDNGSPRLSVTISVTVSAPVSFANQVQPIFTNSCVNVGCHPGGGAPFPLLAGVSYNNLVGVNAATGPCAGDKRVQPSSADASALIKRLDGACGSQMPLGGTPLASAQRQLIRDWINQGARNN